MSLIVFGIGKKYKVIGAVTQIGILGINSNNWNEKFIGKKASIRIHNKWGLIDTSGNFIIEPNYHKVTSLGGDLVGLKKDNKFGIILIRGFKKSF